MFEIRHFDKLGSSCYVSMCDLIIHYEVILNNADNIKQSIRSSEIVFR